MWDFLPVNLNEIKQIEVIRGPASAVWGANALYGVVNVITKSPREMQGTSATFGFGTFETTNDADAGSLWYVSGTHAQAINDRWAFKLSAGGYSQDPLSRPTGIIPGIAAVSHRRRHDLSRLHEHRARRSRSSTGASTTTTRTARKLSFSGGVAGTDGIMHSGIGPFDINSGSVMSYAKANYTGRALRAGFFTNMLNGDAGNLLTRDPHGEPIAFAFDTKTFDFDISNVQTFAKRHVVNYGGNLRFNKFDLSLAPQADNRTEFGIYGQDEIFLSDHFRWVDRRRAWTGSTTSTTSCSRRATTFLIKPQENQTFRVSYNRAYRSPSVINNFLDVTIAEPINLGPVQPAARRPRLPAAGQHRSATRT